MSDLTRKPWDSSFNQRPKFGRIEWRSNSPSWFRIQTDLLLFTRLILSSDLYPICIRSIGHLRTAGLIVLVEGQIPIIGWKSRGTHSLKFMGASVMTRQIQSVAVSAIGLWTSSSSTSSISPALKSDNSS